VALQRHHCQVPRALGCASSYTRRIVGGCPCSEGFPGYRCDEQQEAEFFEYSLCTVKQANGGGFGVEVSEMLHHSFLNLFLVRESSVVAVDIIELDPRV
jgi:hypothetical protein